MTLSDKPLISRSEIHRRLGELGSEISRDYDGRELLVVIVLRGSVIFAADLVRHLRVPLVMDFIRARSYRGTRSKGTVEFTFLPEASLTGKHVLIIEDILDTGRTVAAIFDRLEAAGTESLRLCTLLDKPHAHGEDIQADYVGFTVGDEFVVGYGLDYNERHRELPEIFTLVRA